MDVRFADKQKQIDETRDKLPGIYEEIEKIKQRMIDEKERLVESAKESMMLKLTLKNQIMMKWESPENKDNAEADSESPDHSHPRMFSLN